MTILRVLLLIVVVAIGAAIGFGAGLVYTGVSGSGIGMSIACRLLTTAEQQKIITKAQSVAIAGDAWTSRHKKGKPKAPESEAENLKLVLDYIKDDCRY